MYMSQYVSYLYIYICIICFIYYYTMILSKYKYKIVYTYTVLYSNISCNIYSYPHQVSNFASPSHHQPRRHPPGGGDFGAQFVAEDAEPLVSATIQRHEHVGGRPGGTSLGKNGWDMVGYGWMVGSQSGRKSSKKIYGNLGRKRKVKRCQEKTSVLKFKILGLRWDVDPRFGGTNCWVEQTNGTARRNEKTSAEMKRLD